ncbi:unnamed protein product [Rotaria magnacalcarata]|uniref:Phosphomethylpyrimidine kinase n=1 Tax=Rotaria magnacalcarata TaxID=392030 RepID=A0A816Y5Y2_9BILA|nr:unnamed protein product [Rotaria magnacalcarata]CAF4710671.1 unnamed protein product [Rotaria magnacalcarata]
MPQSTFLSYPIDEHRYINVLTIAGSDPSGGAGLQADLKTFASLHCYGMSIITALTAQNTCGVDSIHSLPSTFVRQQLESVFNDIRIDAIKLGMLEREEIINEVAQFLEEKGADTLPPLVVDPVIYAKSGDQIIDNNAITILKEKIIPFATLLTPNRQEACRLLGRDSVGVDDLEEAAKELIKLGPKAVVIKGGDARDCLVFQGQKNPIWIGETKDWVDTPNVHGTGCTYAAAITSFLGRGDQLLTAVQKAKIYITEAIRAGATYEQGRGAGPVCHHWLSIDRNFIQIAWLSISEIYNRIKQLLFLSEIADGTLQWKKFSFFIQQDHLFLLDRKVVCDLLLSRIINTNDELKLLLKEIADSSELGAENIFRKYNVTDKSAELHDKSMACMAYTNYLKNLAKNNNPILFTLVGLVPCALIYQKVGEYLKRKQQTESLPPTNQYYQVWIDTYSSEQRRQSIEKLLAMVNRLYSSTWSSNQHAELMKIFQKAAEYECEFWTEAYNSV